MVGFYGISTIVGYLMPNPLFTYIFNICGLVLLGFIGDIKHCWLFKAIPSLCIKIKYIWFGLVGIFCITTIVGYLIPNPLSTYILIIYGLVGFYGISTIVDYLRQFPLDTLILNTYDLVWSFFVWFFCISTILVYLMPNPLSTYIVNPWFLNTFCW